MDNYHRLIMLVKELREQKETIDRELAVATQELIGEMKENGVTQDRHCGFIFSLYKPSPKIEIDDVEELPDGMWKKAADTKAIRKYFADNDNNCDFATMVEQDYTVRIAREKKAA